MRWCPSSVAEGRSGRRRGPAGRAPGRRGGAGRRPIVSAAPARADPVSAPAHRPPFARRRAQAGRGGRGMPPAR
ncbi:hypothetical protein FM106_30915 [Brachybacterium faecium]|nr:hypothetical protein FM106_30915 [Brachybacterium faecium]